MTLPEDSVEHLEAKQGLWDKLQIEPEYIGWAKCSTIFCLTFPIPEFGRFFWDRSEAAQKSYPRTYPCLSKARQNTWACKNRFICICTLNESSFFYLMCVRKFTKHMAFWNKLTHLTNKKIPPITFGFMNIWISMGCWKSINSVTQF